MFSISLTASIASIRPSACTPAPITLSVLAFSFARYLVATPEIAPVLTLVRKPPSNIDNVSPVS